MRKADKNADNKMSLKELKHFLRQINIEVDDGYAETLFKVRDKSLSLTISSISTCTARNKMAFKLIGSNS